MPKIKPKLLLILLSAGLATLLLLPTIDKSPKKIEGDGAPRQYPNQSLLPGGWNMHEEEFLDNSFALPVGVDKIDHNEPNPVFDALYGSPSNRFYIYIYKNNPAQILLNDHQTRACIYSLELANYINPPTDGPINCSHIDTESIDGADYNNGTYQINDIYFSFTDVAINNVHYVFTSVVDAIRANQDENGNPHPRLQLIPLNAAEIMAQDLLARTNISP